MKSGRIEYIGYKYYNKRQKNLDSLMGLSRVFCFIKLNIMNYAVVCGQIRGHTEESGLCQI